MDIFLWRPLDFLDLTKMHKGNYKNFYDPRAVLIINFKKYILLHKNLENVSIVSPPNVVFF